MGNLLHQSCHGVVKWSWELYHRSCVSDCDNNFRIRREKEYGSDFDCNENMLGEYDTLTFSATKPLISLFLEVIA